jgi:cytoskeletal protein RodZ
LREENLILKYDKESSSENSRLHQRVKRKKANVILNSLIIIVLLLIVVVSINIFGKDDKTIAERNSEQTVSNTVEKDSEKDGQTDKSNHDEESSDKDESSNQNQNEQDEKINEEEQAETEEESNAENEINNPDRKPVGSSQIEPAQDYIKGSVDWNEQIQAISSATGFDQGKGDTLIRLQNNGPKKSAATVLIKETNQKYRVYLEWVDGEGWKPALVEETN